MRYKIVALAIILAAGAITSLSQETPNGNAAKTEHASFSGWPSHLIPDRHPRYKIRKGDIFDLDFALSPEFNQTVAVQPDGYGTLRGGGSIYVEGQTVPELTETMKSLYAKILHDPIVTIVLKDFEKPYFFVSGQVSKPGKYELRSDLTLTEALAVAGGFNEKAKHSQVVLFRPAAGGYQASVLNVKQLLARRDLSEDIHLEPGDVVYVPQSSMSKIRPFLPTSSMGAYYNPATY